VQIAEWINSLPVGEPKYDIQYTPPGTTQPTTNQTKP